MRSTCRTSSDRVRYGKLSKAGNALLRYVAVLFAQNVTRNRQDTPFKRKYYRLCQTHDRNELKIMLARDFLAEGHSMWTNTSDWQSPRPAVVRETVSVAWASVAWPMPDATGGSGELAGGFSSAPVCPRDGRPCGRAVYRIPGPPDPRSIISGHLRGEPLERNHRVDGKALRERALSLSSETNP